MLVICLLAVTKYLTRRYLSAGEVAQWAKALADKPNDLSSIPGTHVGEQHL